MSGTARAGSDRLVPELQELHDQFEAIRGDAQALVDGLRPDQLDWRPAADRWSIAECLEHLTLTAETTFADLDERVAEARAQGSVRGRPYRPNFLERWMLGGMEPPPRMKFRVSRRLAPPPAREPEEAVSRFFEIQDGIQRRLASVNDLDLVGIRVRSPVVSWLRYRLGFAFAVLAAHERRHLWQAREVRNDSRFPH